MSTLIIAEKPSLAKDIANAISTSSKKVGGDYYECPDGTKVVWLYGHLLTLKEPEDYDEKYADHSDLSLLPIWFPNWECKAASADKKTRVAMIGKLLKESDTVIHAGDPDEEGQLLVDEILRWHKYKGTVKRLDTGNTTREALQKALKHLKDNKLSENDGLSAYARSMADFIVGINLSRLYSTLNKMNLPFGRVKIPTLGLVVARDMQIEGHKSINYYEIEGTGDIYVKHIKVPVKYVPKKDDPNLVDGRILSKPYAESKVGVMNAFNGPAEITKKNTKNGPPLPFNLTKLQSYCSTQFGYDPSETLNITQDLRTKYNAITYNRSDCQYLSSEHFKEAPKTVAATLSNLGLKVPGLDTSIKSRCFNDSYITAHFAIIPSGKKFDISVLTARERNVYTAICKYYLIQFMPWAEKEITKLVANLSDGATAESSSTVITKQGYLALLKGEKKKAEEEETSSDLSSIPAGNYGTKIVDSKVVEKATKPPARYTKATLNEDMTRIAKYVETEEVRKLLLEKDKDKKGENGSIGTPATRPTIIDDIIKLGYVKEEGKKLISTTKGREYYRILPDHFKKADLTAYWWVMQEDIKLGKKTPDDLVKSVVEEVTKELDAEKAYIDKGKVMDFAVDGETVGVCPICGSPVITKEKGYFCSKTKKADCSFALWKKPMLSLFKKITISPQNARDLLSGKSIETSKLYSEKKGVTFPGSFRFEVDKDSKYGGSLQVDFGLPSIGTCPVCGGEIVETSFGFKCSNSGCRTIVWKTGAKGSLFEKTTITRANATKLFAGKTVKFSKLYSKKTGKTFPAEVKLEVNDAGDGVNLKVLF